jgi:hypothetical protein
LLLADRLHVAPHALDLLGQVVYVVVGLLDAGVDKVDQIVDLVDLEAVQGVYGDVHRSILGEALALDLLGHALEGFVLVGDQISIVLHEFVGIDGLVMQTLDIEQRFCCLMLGLLRLRYLSVPIQKQRLMQSILPLLRMRSLLFAVLLLRP